MASRHTTHRKRLVLIDPRASPDMPTDKLGLPDIFDMACGWQRAQCRTRLGTWVRGNGLAQHRERSGDVRKGLPGEDTPGGGEPLSVGERSITPLVTGSDS